jgi:EAL domain-containing protein (putative c-di-GMP-specific phosphodiesterase class I)
VAINVSPQQFRNIDLLANVTQALVEMGLPPGQLELEITESVLAQDAPETMHICTDLSDLGISLSLDDFGTGY